DSLLGSGGRLEAFSTLNERGFFELIFGSGLGLRTNSALNLLGPGSVVTSNGGIASAFVPTDSALLGLLIQIGVFGTLLFYGALLWAALRDRTARLFYFSVAMCSLTVNITELFPTNVLLGLAWAHSLWGVRFRTPTGENFFSGRL